MAILTGFGLSGSFSTTVVAAATATVVALGGFVTYRATQPAQTDGSEIVGTTGSDPVSAVKKIDELTNPDANDASALAANDGDMAVSATIISEGLNADGGGIDGVSAETGVNQPKISVPGFPSPVFDLVRVDQNGAAIIAGKSLAGNQLDILADGVVMATVTPDAKGNFVAFFDLPDGDQPIHISLLMHAADGQKIASAETVLLTPVPGRNLDPDKADVLTAEVDENGNVVSTDVLTADASQAQPSIVIASSDGVKLVQPAIAEDALEAPPNVTVDAITYNAEGEVLLAGRGQADHHIRIYVNNEPVKTAVIAPDGSWALDLPEVAAGVYTLRIDELDDDGAVTSRFETPFKKEFPEAAKRVASAAEVVPTSDATPEASQRVLSVTVQPGSTLWALAEERYGEGELYVRIYGANQSLIRDPDLIYPGQIFNLPD